MLDSGYYRDLICINFGVDFKIIIFNLYGYYFDF